VYLFLFFYSSATFIHRHTADPPKFNSTELVILSSLTYFIQKKKESVMTMEYQLRIFEERRARGDRIQAKISLAKEGDEASKFYFHFLER
jgi:myosin-crossreactive antigen